jgi:hypothetical protein
MIAANAVTYTVETHSDFWRIAFAVFVWAILIAGFYWVRRK